MEYPCARVSSNFLRFLHHFVLAKLATSSISVKADVPTYLQKFREYLDRTLFKRNLPLGYHKSQAGAHRKCHRQFNPLMLKSNFGNCRLGL